jgi:centrosomal protein CEP290
MATSPQHTACLRPLQVSEKIVALDEELKQLQVHEGELHAKMETLAREKTQLMAAADELRAEVADKMELLDEFEDRFKRQYRCVCVWGGGGAE